MQLKKKWATFQAFRSFSCHIAEARPLALSKLFLIAASLPLSLTPCPVQQGSEERWQWSFWQSFLCHSAVNLENLWQWCTLKGWSHWEAPLLLLRDAFSGGFWRTLKLKCFQLFSSRCRVAPLVNVTSDQSSQLNQTGGGPYFSPRPSCFVAGEQKRKQKDNGEHGQEVNTGYISLQMHFQADLSPGLILQGGLNYWAIKLPIFNNSMCY